MKLPSAVAALLLLPALAASAQRLTVDTATPVSTVSPMLYGLMTEEINHAYDGGLYAEMIRNRAFYRNWAGYEGWGVYTHGTGHATIGEGTEGPSTALPKSLKLTVTSAGPGNDAGLVNEGFWGMGIRPSTVYTGSLFAKSEGIGAARVSLVDDNTGQVLAETSIDLMDGGWKHYGFSLKTNNKVTATPASHLTLTFARPGTVLLQLVSLMPPTFHDHGTRADLMERMAALKPTFLRLPGGNYLEGDTIQDRFDWKKTIGPLVERPTHQGPWGYRSSDGMGLLEFLEWCEDLKIEPLLAVYDGYSLHGEHVTGKALEPFIQDALDEIEYITGDAATKWGALRLRDGHPAPFPLHYIEIGNEDFVDNSHTYDERFSAMAAAIRAKYPQYKLIATTPVKQGSPDLVDDHFYKSPEEFFAMAHYYDKADRNGPKIFVGEWATRTGSPTPDFGAALGDAAWMTGMERNSDLILLSAYAPLLVNVNPGAVQWSPNLIGYDALNNYVSPSYWAQVLFAEHLGDHTVKTAAQGISDSLFWSATVSTADKVLHLKLVNSSDKTQELQLDIPGAKPGTAAVTSLHGATRWETNTLQQPDRIHPVQSKTNIPAAGWKHTLPANTIEVLDIPLR